MCMTPQALSQALKGEGQVLVIVGNQLVHKAGSPDVADFAMRAVYLNPETGQGYVVTGNAPLDKTGEKQQPITCSTVEMKMDHVRLYNQASKAVSPSALMNADRSAAVAQCAKEPARQPDEICEFHNDNITGLVTGGAGLMFQGTVTASTSAIPVNSLVSLLAGRSNNHGFLEYTTANGVVKNGQFFDYVGYTEKGVALLSRRPREQVASLD